MISLTCRHGSPSQPPKKPPSKPENAYPNASQKDLREWFGTEYNHTLLSSLISDILSSKYSPSWWWPTTLPRFKVPTPRELARAGECLVWLITHVERQIFISAEIIWHKAEYFWDIIYPWMVKPTFSNGWLHWFQAWRNVKRHEQHGEAGDVPKQAEHEMVMTRQALSAYSPKDQFNCDETALLWKQTPARSLSTRQLPGRKIERARASALFCCNVDGSWQTRSLVYWNCKKSACF